MNPILIVALVALVVVVYAASASIGSHYGYKIGMKEVEVEHKACQADLAIANNKAEQMGRDLDTLAERWEQEHAQTTKLRDDLMVTMTTIKHLRAENAAIAKERDTAIQAFTELDILHQKTVAERAHWQGLYGELVNTLHDAQGDAHATVPLQEVAPVKRTRKKAGAQ